MEKIRILGLVCPDTEVSGMYSCCTTYPCSGSGNSPEDAKRCAVESVIEHLRSYLSEGLPPPDVQLRDESDILHYFSGRMPEIPAVESRVGRVSIIAEDEIMTLEPADGLPKLVFEFYRIETVE